MHRVVIVLSFAFLITFATHAAPKTGQIDLGSTGEDVIIELQDNWDFPDLLCAGSAVRRIIQFVKDLLPGQQVCASLLVTVTGDGTTDNVLDYEWEVTYDGGSNEFTTLLDIDTVGSSLTPIDISADGTYVFGQISVTTAYHESPVVGCSPSPGNSAVPALGIWGWLLGAGVLGLSVFLIVRRGLG